MVPKQFFSIAACETETIHSLQLVWQYFLYCHEASEEVSGSDREAGFGRIWVLIVLLVLQCLHQSKNWQKGFGRPTM